MTPVFKGHVQNPRCINKNWPMCLNTPSAPNRWRRVQHRTDTHCVGETQQQRQQDALHVDQCVGRGELLWSGNGVTHGIQLPF